MGTNGAGTKPTASQWDSQVYAKARPGYPDSLFALLADISPGHDVAWDVATGNGQAAVSLAKHYKKVIATDVSDEQLSFAFTRPNITYQRMNAEPDAEELNRIVGAEGSVDLVTVATALHWFNLDHFFPLVHHVLRKQGGVFSAWSYMMPIVSPEVDAETLKLLRLSFVHGYSDPRYEMMMNNYATIPFPFEPVLPHTIGTEPIEVEPVVKNWNLDELLVFLESFSTVKRAIENGVNLVHGEYVKSLQEAWGPFDCIRPVSFPVWLRVGKMPST